MAATKQPERKFIDVSKAPPYVKELLMDHEITIPIAKSFKAIDAVIQEATRNAVTLPNQADMAPMLQALGHLFSHFRMMRDQGNHDIKYLEQISRK